MLDGIINIHKEKGYTSHDVVARLRGILGQKKIGHTGTLDPDASGVLPVCLGRATKLCGMLTEKEKTYRAVLLLGKVTDTQDISGKVLKEYPVMAGEEEIRSCIESFQGDILQIPPMYSACKVQGKRLYQLAREGLEAERSPRPVHIRRIAVQDVRLPRVKLEVTCSKGTYIRTLCNDIGHQLGCGGCMEELVRTRSGIFHIEQSLYLAQVEQLQEEGNLGEKIIRIEEILGIYPRLDCTEEQDRLLNNGNPLPAGHGSVREGWVRVHDSKGVFKGIYQHKEGTGRYFPVKMFL